MKKWLVPLIIVVTSVAFTGIMLTQIMWVKRAIILRSEQFDLMIDEGLENILARIEDMERDSLLSFALSSGLKDSVAETMISKDDYQIILDTLIKGEFACLKVNEEFNYAVVDSNTQEFIFGKYEEVNKPGILSSVHRMQLSSVFPGKPFVIYVFFPEEVKLIIRRMDLWLVALSGVFLMVVLACFLHVIFSILRQKKLSEMKNDFINNMTHEFKTPISTISVAAEMLMKPAVYASAEKTLRYSNIIFDENLRLRNQVEQALQISLMDRNNFQLRISFVDTHKILENTIDIFNFVIRDKKGCITCSLDAEKYMIEADEVHFINIISNMIDNSIKYSAGPPQIHVSTANKDKGILIRFEDNGIGIRAEDRKHIFKQFFRVHTGNRHDVKGFGLGLYYVKTVVDAHKGYINLVQSDTKKGSIFEIYFPYSSGKELIEDAEDLLNNI